MAEIVIPLLSRNANPRIVGFAFSAVLLLLGSAETYFSVASVRRGVDSRRWQPVQARVVSIKWHTPNEGPDYPTMVYRYAVDGRQYEGSNIIFGAASDGTCKVRTLAEGGPVGVFVNPGKPDESVVLPGTSSFPKANIAAGAILLAVGAFCALAAWRYQGGDPKSAVSHARLRRVEACK